jgi:hypothetical protein
VLRDLAAGRPASAYGDENSLGDRGRELRLAQGAALAALGAPAASWVGYLGDNSDEIDEDDVAAVLIAIASIIGAPRVAAAAEGAIAGVRFFQSDETG